MEAIMRRYGKCRMHTKDHFSDHAWWEKGFAYLLSALLTGLPGSVALANPTGEQVISGDVSFSENGNYLTINASDGAIIGYTGFDIDLGETVEFIQPGPNAKVLNRVIDSLDPTYINGSLLANGQVYIVNSMGVFFGQNALIDVATLYAAAGSMSNEDFLAGLDQFTNLSGPVENFGEIFADAVHLIGQRVANHGSIVAEDGLITMIAGENVIFSLLGSRMSVKISSDPGAEPIADAPGVENSGVLDAGNGVVNLSAGDIYALAVWHTGTTTASEIVIEGGDGGIV